MIEVGQPGFSGWNGHDSSKLAHIQQLLAAMRNPRTQPPSRRHRQRAQTAWESNCVMNVGNTATMMTSMMRLKARDQGFKTSY